MPIQIRSKMKENCDITLNAKGHPTIGLIAPKKRVSSKKYESLHDIALKIEEMTENLIMDDIFDKAEFDATYRQIYEFVFRSTEEPSFDEINDMLLIARSLLEVDEHRDFYAEFILNCPHKFIMTYSNNSEKIQHVLRRLTELELDSVRKYLIGHIHESKLKTLNERRDIYL